MFDSSYHYYHPSLPFPLAILAYLTFQTKVYDFIHVGFFFLPCSSLVILSPILYLFHTYLVLKSLFMSFPSGSLP